MTTSDSRDRFEKYWKAQANFKESMLSKDGRFPDYYGNTLVQASWEAWQAALSHQSPSVAVSELEDLAEEWERECFDLDGNVAYVGCVADIRELIKEAGSDE